jgi:hypothetical protein
MEPIVIALVVIALAFAFLRMAIGVFLWEVMHPLRLLFLGILLTAWLQRAPMP